MGFVHRLHYSCRSWMGDYVISPGLNPLTRLWTSWPQFDETKRHFVVALPFERLNRLLEQVILGRAWPTAFEYRRRGTCRRRRFYDKTLFQVDLLTARTGRPSMYPRYPIGASWNRGASSSAQIKPKVSGLYSLMQSQRDSIAWE